MTPQTLDGWDYEFRHWKHTIGFEPVALIASVDESPCWEMDRRHVFLCQNGSYAAVIESGCSCYEPSEAEISFYPTEAEARDAARIPPSANVA